MMLPFTAGHPMLRSLMETLAASQDFLHSWQSLGESSQIAYSRLLLSTDDLLARLQRNGTLYHAHTSALGTLRTYFADVRQRERQASPDPEARIRWSADAAQVAECYLEAWERLRRLVLARNLAYVVRWTGIKRGYAVATKVAQYRAGDHLDLDDVVSFRFSFANLRDLRLFLDALLTAFDDDILRLRDYYTWPRSGPDDAYRAQHVLIALPRLSPYALFEIQLVTAIRDVVGLLDHDSIYKRTLVCACAAQREWLLGLRMAANVADAALAGFYRLRTI